MDAKPEDVGLSSERLARVNGWARRLVDDGKLAGTADEGGWWPAFSSNEEGLGYLTRAIERAGYRPGDDVFISLDIAASEFYRDGTYRMALDYDAPDHAANARPIALPETQ